LVDGLKTMDDGLGLII